MRKRIGAAAAALLVVLITLAAIFHNGAARFALSAILPMATGYSVQVQDLHLQAHHGALVGVHVSHGGQTVLDARRIDVFYNLRDLLPGSTHRFGLTAITVDRPEITIVHNENGTYNIAIPRAVSGGTGRRAANNVPLNFTVRVRDASAALIDEYRFYEQSRRQRVDHINVDIAINSAIRTRYKATGLLEDAGPQPFRIAGTIDYLGGYAIHHVQVRAIPIGTIGNYFINSPAAHILGGTVRDFDLHAWAYGIGPGSPAAYHLSGSGYLRDGRMIVKTLDSPIEDLNGPINVFDSGFAMQRTTGTVGHLHIVIAGGLFNFAHPQFRLGVDGSGDLRYLKEVAHFAAGLPIHGGVRIHALIEGDITDPVLMIGYGGKRFNYGDVPIDNPRGVVALYQSKLIVLPFHAVYDGIKMHLEGLLQLGKQVQSTLALRAIGPSARMPYLSGLVTNQPILMETLLSGTDVLFDARGYLVSLASAQNVNGFFNISRLGVGTFGPISVRTPSGGSLVAGFSLDRPHGNSAFWASVRDIRLNQPVPIAFPGVNIPQLPPMDAHIAEANVAGAGSAHNTVIGGAVFMAPAKIAGVPFDTIAARFAGPFAASRISSVHADGPWGTFDGNGTFAPNLIVARGDYSGNFTGLRMFLGGFPVQGEISGPMGIAIAQGKIFVQAQNAQLRNANMHGIPISSVTGTMAYDNGILRVYAAQARAAGGTVVAAGSYGTLPDQHTRLTLATTNLKADEAMRGFGVPISGGTIRAVGAIAPSAAVPNIDAGVVLRNGRAAGYGPFSASSEVAIANDTLRVHDTIASLGPTFAHVRGSVGNLAGGVPVYDVQASVPVGHVASMARLAGVPTYHADGSFGAQLHIGGSGTNPAVRGDIDVPVGQINGLGFRDAHAAISASRGGVSIQRASVRIGSTKAAFSATVTTGELAFSMSSQHADLSDFNDYFDTGDTLAGSGAVALSFSHFDHLTYTSGDIDVQNLRYRRFPIGDTDADWTSLRNIAQGRVVVGGDHGRLRAAGTIAFAPGAQLSQLITRSRYDINGTLSDFDLTTWLPALGFPQLPITGRVNGIAQVRGSFPHLSVTGDASLINGTVGPLTIEKAEVSARTAPGDRIDITRMNFALPALQGNGTGSFGLARNAPMHLQVHAVTDDLPRLVAQISKKRLDVRGHIESTVSIDGTFHAPRVVAGVDASNVDLYGLTIPSLVGQVELRRRSVVVRNAEVAFARGRATIAGSLPLELQPFALGPASAPIAMDLSASDLDLSTFGAFMGHGTKLGGVLNGHLGVSGTIGNPRMYGQLGVNGGSYVSALETVPITQTVAQLVFDGTHASLEHAHAKLGSGTLDASGSLNFGGGLNGGPLGYALALQTHHAQVAMPQFGSGTFDAAISLQRTPGELALLKGNATLTDTVISFNSLLALSGGGAPGSAPAPPPFNVAFDMGIDAGRNVRVRSGGPGVFGLDITGQGRAHLSGTLEHPQMAGEFNSKGGTLTLIDRAFKIQEGQVTFNPANGALPDINAVATTTVFNPDPNPQRNPTGNTEITAMVRGTVPNVGIDFTTSPGDYTKQQIIALLLPLNSLVGPIQFTDTGVILPAGQLPGAPAAGSGAPLPNIFVLRQNGTVTIGQEAFSILNAQFASGLLAPVETALGSTLGISDVNLTVDYGGNVGVNLRRPLGPNFYAVYGTTFGVPVRQTWGFAYSPNAYTSAQLTMFAQQGPTPLFLSAGQVLSSNPRATAGQAIQGTSGFTFLFQRLF